MRVKTRGWVAGLLAASAFAVWFLLVDVVKQQPLASLAYMSGLLFSFTTALPATARLAAFLLVLAIMLGLIAHLLLVLFARTSLAPTWGVAGFAGLLLFGVLAAGSVLVFQVNLVTAVGWLHTLIASLLAGAVLVGYLRKKRGA